MRDYRSVPRRNINDVLASARSELRRLTPREAAAAMREGAASGHPSPALAGRTYRLILICADGHSSSLAALRLHELEDALSDRPAGLPVVPERRWLPD